MAPASPAGNRHTSTSSSPLPLITALALPLHKQRNDIHRQSNSGNDRAKKAAQQREATPPELAKKTAKLGLRVDFIFHSPYNVTEYGRGANIRQCPPQTERRDGRYQPEVQLHLLKNS
ncbi:unknown protein [Desulfotalea psychrophila LSv54]|uniref:Uncharacterized protein n=1 Tax=Desulfotalea psychrophila (strain LSv54 / DSM 12343) TaxID=177439 RepID=Q6ARJ2_DESPS|nr:unknown protein [Desulfotalea psychrophila LSv54]